MRVRYFTDRNRRMFGRFPLAIAPVDTLPLPDLGSMGDTPWALNMEHLQDFCNKSTVIYCTDSTHDFTRMYEYIFKQWWPDDIHKLDVEFAHFVAKLVCIAGGTERRPTTQHLIKVHEALWEASLAGREKDFTKEEYGTDFHFIGGHQVEFFNLKPLLRALFIVVDKRFDERTSKEVDFDAQKVRVVRTGRTTGLTRPITFDGLNILEEINETKSSRH